MEFELARFIGERQQVFAVWHEAGFAVTDARLVGDPHEAAPLGGCHEDAAPRREDDAFPLRMDVGGRQMFDRPLDPLLAELIEVGSQGDRHHAVDSARDVVEPDVGSQLVDDSSLLQVGRLNVPAAVFGVLFQVAAGVFHRPDIERAVPIGDEIDAAVLPHRRETLADVIGSEIRGLGVLRGESPDFAGRAAVVAFDGLAMERRTHEVNRAVGIDGRLARLAEGNSRVPSVGQIDLDQLEVGQRRIVLGVVEQVSARRPTDGDGSVGGERAPRWRAAFEGHRVELGRPLVGRGEREQLPIGRNPRVRFLTRMRSQPPGHASFNTDGPDVPLGHEGDRVAVNRGISVIALRCRGIRGQRDGPKDESK